jgi:PKD domain-containing protein
MKTKILFSIGLVILSSGLARSQADEEIDGPALICKSPYSSTTANYEYRDHSYYPYAKITYSVQDRAGNPFNIFDLSTSTTAGKLTVTIDKNDFDFIVKMKVKQDSTSGSSPTNTYYWKSQVGTGDLPTNDMISFSNTPNCGSSSYVTVTIDKESSFGVEFYWTLPNGWSQVEGGLTNRIVVQPNGLNGGNISCVEKFIGDEFCSGDIYGDITNPAVSKAISLSPPVLSRILPAGSGISIEYNETNPITFTASSFTSSGETYEWTLPCGWTGPSGQTGTFVSTSRSVQITPTGYSGPGEKVKVRAILSCSGTQTPSNTIEWSISWGNTGSPEMTGPFYVCTSNTTFTLHDVPPSATITWTISSNLIYVSGQYKNRFKY